MLSVPSVTINGGSLILVTRKPLMKPVSAPTAMPRRSARGPGTPSSSLSRTSPVGSITAVMVRSPILSAVVRDCAAGGRVSPAAGRLGGRGAPPAQTGVRSAGRQDQAFQQTLASWPEVPLGTPATGLSG